MDYKRIAFILIAGIIDLCEQHAEYEESLGGFENIRDVNLKGQLQGQQDILYTLAELISKIVPNEAEGFYTPTQDKMN